MVKQKLSEEERKKRLYERINNWKKKHREELNQKEREKYATNPDSYLKRAERYRIKNRDLINAKAKARYKKLSEKEINKIEKMFGN